MFEVIIWQKRIFNWHTFSVSLQQILLLMYTLDYEPQWFLSTLVKCIDLSIQLQGWRKWKLKWHTDGYRLEAPMAPIFKKFRGKKYQEQQPQLECPPPPDLVCFAPTWCSHLFVNSPNAMRCLATEMVAWFVPVFILDLHPFGDRFFISCYIKRILF